MPWPEKFATMTNLFHTQRHHPSCDAIQKPGLLLYKARNTIKLSRKLQQTRLKCLPANLAAQLFNKIVVWWQFKEYYNFSFVKSYLLEAYFDLISCSPVSMKIQIIGGKITENLHSGRSIFLFFFLFIFKFSIKKLHIFVFNHFWINCFTNQIQWTLVIVNSVLSPILFTNERCSLFSM